MKKLRKLLVILSILTACLAMAVPTSAAIKISSESLTLIKGQSTTLEITGTEKDVKWSSNKKSVATVSSQGKVTAKKKGTATITAKVGKKKLVCKVKVEVPKLSRKALSLEVGKTAALKISGTSQKIIWESSDTAIATVTADGVVLGVKGGNCIITAAIGEKKYSCKVMVKGDSSPGTQAECGKGTFYIIFASGTSQNGNIPEVYVDRLYPFGYVDYYASDVDNSVPIHVFIDGKQIDVDYVGYALQKSFPFSGDEMKEGIHTVEMYQYKGNDPNGEVITYRKAQYKVVIREL